MTGLQSALYQGFKVTADPLQKARGQSGAGPWGVGKCLPMCRRKAQIEEFFYPSEMIYKVHIETKIPGRPFPPLYVEKSELFLNGWDPRGDVK